MKKVYARERTLKRADGGACGIDYIRQMSMLSAQKTKVERLKKVAHLAVYH